MLKTHTIAEEQIRKDTGKPNQSIVDKDCDEKH